MSTFDLLTTGLALTPVSDLRTGRVARPWQVFFDALAKQLQEVAAMPSPWYGNQTRAAQVFNASVFAAHWGTVLTAAAVTLTLYNPADSRVLLGVARTTAFCTTALTGITAQLQYVGNLNTASAAPASPVEVVSYSGLLGSPVDPIGKAYSSCTLPEVPVAIRIHPWSTIPSDPLASAIDEVAGQLLVVPGTCLTLQGIGTDVAGWLSMTWVEMAI